MPKLTVLDVEITLRQKVAEIYISLLRDGGIAITPYLESHNISAWAQFTVRVMNREIVQKALHDNGIPNAVHYPLPLNLQPAVADASVRLPSGNMAAKEVLSLPVNAYLTPNQIKRIVNSLSI
jgi:UDP-2-acetamido-2-deoxy-ribo-hexuluronate aminotransferase